MTSAIQEGPPACSVVASGGVLSEEYGHDGSRRLPRRWPDGSVYEGYEYDGPGICLGDDQTEAYVKDMGMTGMASARVVARRRPEEYRH